MQPLDERPAHRIRSLADWVQVLGGPLWSAGVDGGIWWVERAREKSGTLKQGKYKFQRNQDRHCKTNKLPRVKTDAFGAGRTTGNDNATEDNKRNRTSADIRAEKRARSKVQIRTRSRRVPR